jgi:hypothetical protein
VSEERASCRIASLTLRVTWFLPVALLREAYDGVAGHKRPGLPKGLPVDNAERQAAELTARIGALMAAK